MAERPHQETAQLDASLRSRPEGAPVPGAGDASGASNYTSSNADQSKVRIRSLRKLYGDVIAVDDLSLDIKDGEFLTLLGPSGSGKTTVLMMLAGLIKPTSGQILIDGHDTTYKAPFERDMGVVFQNYALFPHMTVAENIAFPLEMRRLSRSEIKTRVSEALDLVRLPQVADRNPRQLSGGQQQRIALARALVFRPSVLLMDEPLGALDKKLREHMQIEIKRIQTSLRLTAVYVTHDQEEALTMSHRIAVMRDGNILQLGSATEMYEHPKSTFIADFFGESNILRGTVVSRNQDRIEIAIEGAGVSDGAIDRTSDSTSWIVSMSASHELQDHRRVVLAVRPEKIDITPPQAPTPEGNSAHGRVEELSYVGESTRYYVRLDFGPLLIVKQSNAHGITRFGVGDRVGVSWHTADTIQIEDD